MEIHSIEGLQGLWSKMLVVKVFILMYSWIHESRCMSSYLWEGNLRENRVKPSFPTVVTNVETGAALSVCSDGMRTSYTPLGGDKLCSSTAVHVYTRRGSSCDFLGTKAYKQSKPVGWPRSVKKIPIKGSAEFARGSFAIDGAASSVQTIA